VDTDNSATWPVSPNQERNITRWIPGLKAGDTAARNLNPLAWKA
jgi:hypothetical protein